MLLELFVAEKFTQVVHHSCTVIIPAVLFLWEPSVNKINIVPPVVFMLPPPHVKF